MFLQSLLGNTCNYKRDTTVFATAVSVNKTIVFECTTAFSTLRSQSEWYIILQIGMSGQTSHTVMLGMAETKEMALNLGEKSSKLSQTFCKAQQISMQASPGKVRSSSNYCRQCRGIVYKFVEQKKGYKSKYIHFIYIQA